MTPDRVIAKCKSWPEFSRAMVSLTKKQKGDAFERLTQLYLLSRPEYRTVLDHVWTCQSDLPAQVRRKLGLPTTDEGIDLVAKTNSGEYWAIQSKFKTDPDKPLTVKELSTFTNLTFNVCAGRFAQALVVHTSTKPVRKRKLLGKTTEIGLERWLDMTPEDWNAIRGLIRGKPVRPKVRRPRPHQKKAIKAAVAHFVDENQSRGKMIMPCGTGKSLTAFWIAEALKAKTVLVVVPSLALIKQGVEDWTREIVAQDESPLPKWLCVCSDESVGKMDRDEFVGETYDLGLPVTTDPKDIERFLGKSGKGRRIIFVTYQSSPQLAKVAKKIGARFDLAIMDEAHKTAGEKSKSFATLLFDKNLKIKKRMFMTATERVVRGAHDEVVSMDAEKVYGKCFYHLSFKDAIHAKPPIISDYKVITLLVTEDEVKSMIADKKFVTDPKRGIDAQDPRELASAIVLRKAFKKHGIKHAVSFHRSIRSSIKFADQQTMINGIKRLRPMVESFHISSKKTAGQRAQLLNDFAESTRAIITNARCLTEGVDVPAIDCVLFADPKHSKIDIVQAAGRALRPYPGKDFGYIMLPLVVPDGMEFEEFADTTEFRNVSRVITALSTQDERIAEEFRVLERGKPRRDGIIRIVGSVPVGLKMSLAEFADAISTRLWERVGRINYRPFDEAREFAQELNLRSATKWREFCKSGKLPSDIPARPGHVYKNKGWNGFGDWLGTGTIAPRSKRAYRPFNEAREFAQHLKLRSRREWNKFCKSGKLPEDIPFQPGGVYKDKGWKGIGDWLGTGNVGRFAGERRPFNEAREFARELQLRSTNEWWDFCKSGKKPEDIPVNPGTVYKDNGWKGYGDWLGTGATATFLRKYRPFNEARKFARELELGSQREWKEFCKSGNLPKDISAAPWNTYKNKGWKGLGDWLGTGAIASQSREYRPFDEAREFAWELKLGSIKEWKRYCKSGKLPDDIPVSPGNTYKDKGWKGFGDWLGTGTVAKYLRKYRPFCEARNFARELKLRSGSEWQDFCKSGKLPEDIPASPKGVYKDKGWKSFGDWLGTGAVAAQLREYRPFNEARKFARELKLRSGSQWQDFCKLGKLPEDIPAYPGNTYKDKGWKSIGDWLGTGAVASYLRVYRPFDEAREFARELQLRSTNEWKKFCKSGKLPKDIPANPYSVYFDKGWISWPDWFGKT